MADDLIQKLEAEGIYNGAIERENWTPVYLSSIQANRGSTSSDYARRAHQVAHAISHSSFMDQPMPIFRHLHAASFNRESQREIQSFLSFRERVRNPKSRHNQFVSWDIETLGSEQGDVLSVTEIAAQEFKRDKSGQFSSSNQRFNVLIRPSAETSQYFSRLIDAIEKDPYVFRSLKSWEQASLINLIRYDTEYADASRGILAAKLDDPRNMRHNTLAELINPRRELMGKYTENMRRGLQSLNRYGIEANEAIRAYNEFVNRNRAKFFVSYNGLNFDIPVLNKWAALNNSSIKQPRNQIDLLRLMQTVYANPIQLHKDFGRNTGVQNFIEGSWTLQEMRRTLGLQTEQAHSALHDVGAEGLGGVFSRVQEKLEANIRQAKTNIQEGFNYHPTHLSWSDEVLKPGQTLFAAGGSFVYDAGEYSFQGVKDESGRIRVYQPGFNRAVINARSFYRFNGVRQVEIDGRERYVLELFNPDENRYSFVVRDTQEQLAEFVQSRFYNWEGLDESTRKYILRAKETDQARRRYERLFSLEGAGRKKTSGFEAAKRMYQNAEVYWQRLMGKEKNIDLYAQAMRQPGETLEMTKRRLREEMRISHKEMLDKMDFNSLWNPEKRRFVHNPDEAKAFWRMAPRLLSELPLYGQAIREIESAFDNPQQRNIAWHLFNQEVEKRYGRFTEIMPLQEFENRGIHFVDRTSPRKERRYINFESGETAFRGIWSYIDREGESQRQQRLTSLITSLQDQSIISRAKADEYYGFIQRYAISDSIKMIVADLMDNRAIIQSQIEVNSLARRKAVELLSREESQNLIQRAIKRTRGFQGFHLQQQANRHILPFTGDVDEFLRRLDEPHRTGIVPSNRQAIERIIQKVNEKNPALMHHLLINEQGTQAKIVWFKPEHSASVTEHVLQGKTHPKSVEMTLPLITRQGTHHIGNQILNARSELIKSRGEIVQRSSVEKIAEGYTSGYRLKNILEAIEEDDYDRANVEARRALREQVNRLAGIRRDLSQSDRRYFKNSLLDYFSQSQVDINSAMIQDLFDKGIVARNEINQRAFYNDRLRQDVTIDDLTPAAQERVRQLAPQWAQEHGYDLYVSGIKGDTGITRLILSNKDIRNYIPYGHYINQGRDNSVQWMNAYDISDEIKERLEGARAYINFNDLVATKEMRDLRREYGRRTGVNVKVAYMTQEELERRVRELSKTEEGRKILMREKIMRPDGSIDPLMMPRVYEQQAVFDRSLLEAFQVENHKFYDMGDDPSTFRWNKDLLTDEGQLKDNIRLRHGDLLGTRIVNGIEEDVYYDGRHEGRIFTSLDDNRIGVYWKEQAHKFMVEGEKMTPGPSFSQELIEAITGERGVGVIYSPNVVKHRDFGAMMAGQAKLIADKINRLEGRERTEFLNAVSRIGLKWDEEEGYFRDISRDRDIDIREFDNIMRKLGISGKATVRIGEQTFKTDIGIQELRASKVSNYSTIVGDNRLPAYGFEGDLPIKGRNIKGVHWGHREMGVLDRIGANETYKYVWNLMIEDAKKTGRLDEAIGTVRAIQAFIDPDAVPDSSQYLHVDQFADIPESDRTHATFKGTIFDQNFIRELTGDANQHGFWLKLPETARPIHVLGSRETIDRIFIPFTHLEGVGSQDPGAPVYLREMQQRIADIYRRASEVQRAGSEDIFEASQRLQQSVDRYFTQLGKDITASVGLAGRSVFRTALPNSGSGLYKILPVAQSIELGDEYVFISPEDAKKMGVFEMIAGKDGEFLSDWTKQNDIYAANLRYPTFHQDALQIAKVRIDPSIKPGEFHATALMADLMAADSDGDYNNITVLKDNRIQREWKRLYKERKRKYIERENKAYRQVMQDMLEGQSTDNRVFGLEEIDELEQIGRMGINTPEEISAKSGKALVGMASDLNYRMRQMARELLPPTDTESLEAIERFGQGLEQKLISSKHGIVGGREMIEAVRSGNWERVLEVDRTYFDSMFANEYRLKEASIAMNNIRQRLRHGLYNEGLNFGTSTGYNVEKRGVRALYNALMGAGEDAIRHNTFARMYRDLLGVEMDAGMPMAEDFETISPAYKQKRARDFVEALTETMHDATGGLIEDVREGATERIQRTIREIFSNSGNRRLALLGGIGLAGLWAGNVFGNSEPVVPLETMPSQGGPMQPPARPASSPPSSPLPPLDEGVVSGADIQVSAKGSGIDRSTLPQMTQEGMRRANFNGGPSSMTINYQDNTTKLSPIWYRDKVEEYV